MTGGALVWAFIKRFWWIGALVALAFVVLIQRNTITDRTAERDQSKAEAAQLRETNKANEDIMKALASRRVDNDAIAEAVAARLGTVREREVNTRTIIERAKQDDPNVRDWADRPIPNSVRDALNTPGR
ncbi:hypothetical protein [Sphingomonas phage Birtae]|nr:hypothetical protein [Sphingomonas phage Birtae]